MSVFKTIEVNHEGLSDFVRNELDRVVRGSIEESEYKNYKRAVLKVDGAKHVKFSYNELMGKAARMTGSEQALFRWAVANVAWYASRKLIMAQEAAHRGLQNHTPAQPGYEKLVKRWEKLRDEEVGDVINLNINDDFPKRYRPAHGESHTEHPLVVLVDLGGKDVALE